MNTEELNFDDKKKELELRKIELENIKLEKELRAWYKKLFSGVNILQILTVLIVIIGAIATYVTNYFQNQNTLLSIQKLNLKKEIDSFTLEIKEIKSTNQNLGKEKRTLTKEVANLRNIKSGLNNRVSELNDTISFMLRTDAFIRKSAKKSLEFSMEFLGNNIDTTKLTTREWSTIKDEIYLTYLRIGAFEKQNSNDGNRIQEWAEKYFSEQRKNDSLLKVVKQYKKLFNE